MRTRQTSIEAYREIKANGLLSKRRLQVYEMLFSRGPMTQTECFTALAEHTGNRNLSHQTIAPRFAELLDRGVISCIGKRPCRITGKICMMWDVTENLPVEPVKKESELAILRRENECMRRTIEDLRVEISELKAVPMDLRKKETCGFPLDPPFNARAS